MKALALMLAALLCSGTAQPPARDGAPPPSDAAFESILEEIDAKSGAIKDLTAKFEQTKHTALLRRPLVSGGVVRVKGALVRWDTQRPHATSMLIDETQIRMYYPDQKTLEVFEVDEAMRRITATPLPRLAVIREQFVIAPAVPEDGTPESRVGRVAVSLTPREDSLRKHVEKVQVVIERATGCASSLKITDADGDTTAISFTDIKTNVGLADSDLALSVPDGTRVVKPLDGLGRSTPPSPPGRREDTP